MEYKQYYCDVLVVGGGGAALRAAAAAKERDKDCRVAIVTKGKLGTTGTTANSCSDRMAFHAVLEHTEPGGEDSWKYHADDIYRIGGEVSDYNLAAVLAKGSKEAFYYLKSLGVPFAMKDGKPDQFVTDGSEYARACYTGPKTAVHIEEALLKRIKELKPEVIKDSMIVDLALDDGRVAGAIGVTRDNELFQVYAKAVILATGGGGEAYKYNVYPDGATGDGYILALNCGAELVNMEFIQIGLSNPQTKLACSGSIMRAVPRFVNDRGEEFLRRYFPEGINLETIYNTVFEKGASWPVSCEHLSSQIDIAVYKEMAGGRKVYLDFSGNPSGFGFGLLNEINRSRYLKEVKTEGMENFREESPIKRLEEINPPAIKWLKERGIDLKQGELLELVPAIQHFQGGVKINEKAETSIRGLYAAGECAGGQHGANRPGGNALMDCQVFGKIAGEEAVQYARRVKEDKNPAFTFSAVSSKYIVDKAELDIGSFKQKVQETMALYGSVVRTEEGLEQGIKELKGLLLKGVVGDNRYEAAEALNIYELSRVVLNAMKRRKESRGPHLYFNSFHDLRPVPNNDSYKQYFIIKKDRGSSLDIVPKVPVGSD